MSTDLDVFTDEWIRVTLRYCNRQSNAYYCSFCCYSTLIHTYCSKFTHLRCMPMLAADVDTCTVRALARVEASVLYLITVLTIMLLSIFQCSLVPLYSQ